MTATSRDAAFWSRIARKYAARPIDNMQGYLDTLDRTKSHLRPSDRALEIGCGTGSTALLLAPHLGHITATDIAPGMIEIARERLAQEKLPNISFEVCEVLDHVAPQGLYDVVLAHNLLHLLPDRQAALAHAASLLRPGGLLISKTVCAPRGPTLRFALIRRLLIPAMQILGKAPFVAFPTAQALDREIEAAGFRIIETKDQAGMMHSRYIVARKI